MPKATSSVATGRQERRHNPLEDDLTATGILKSKSGKRKSRHEDEEEKFVDSKASRKILRIAQELADADESEQNIEQGEKINAAFDLSSRFETSEPEELYGDDGEVWGDEDDVVEEIELDPNDRETFNKFFPTQEDPLLRTGWGGTEEQGEGQPTNLAALILEKIDAFEAAQARGGEAPEPVDSDFEIPAKVVEVYTQ